MCDKKHCGFCDLLGVLFRKSMCMEPRRGSTESCYRELGDQDTLKFDGSQGSEASVEFHIIVNQPRSASGTEHRPIIHQVDSNDGRGHASTSTASDEQLPPASRAQGPAKPRLVAEPTVPQVPAEVENKLALLETGDVTRRMRTGRFHSMYNRNRRNLTTRALVIHVALLDDLFNGQVQCILARCSSWTFNAFALDNYAAGRSLPVLCIHLFKVYGLINHFHLDTVKVWKLFTLIEENYHSSNPYHNRIHATDVTQAMHCFLQQNQILPYMEPIDVMAGLLAAIAHDLDHPGVNQPFLVATSNHLVDLYQCQSVLENHHWRSAISCIIESTLIDDMPEYRQQLHDKIRSLILATDITRQQEYLGQFKMYLDTGTLDMTRSEHRHHVLQMALKCSDISNPCRSWEISKTWSLKVCEEFFRQGDAERKLNLPLSPLCDRNNITVPAIQTGFFKFIVTPLITEWHRFLKSDLSLLMLSNLVENHTRWEEMARENSDVNESDITVAATSIVAIGTEEEQDSANLSDSSEMLLPRRSSLNPERPFGFREQLRRFSAPLNVFQDGRPKNKEQALQEVASVTVTDGNSGSKEQEDRSPKISQSFTSCDSLFSELTIASITTPIQAKRISHVFNDRNWRLVRQPTCPALQVMPRPQSLIPRATSQEDCCFYPRDAKSDSSIKLDDNQDENRGLKCRIGNRLRENLTAVPLDLGRIRKAAPAQGESMCTAARERRFRELREVLPALIARTLTPWPGGARGRRGSAPVGSATEERPAQLLPPAASGRPLPSAPARPTRRGSLPVEMYLHVELFPSSE